ncbi:MAG: hypothetical protein MI919_11595 [Holophagales bacterium]|nr:hypothetical protein [Holophagales bacterium]
MHTEKTTRAALGLPGVKAYLDAVDRVANSNTFLLAAGDRLGSLTPAGIFDFLDSPAFSAAMYECDAERGWFNLHDTTDLPEQIESVRDLYSPRPGELLCVEEPTQLDVVPLTREALREKLLWLLVGVWSPYRENLPDREAAVLVDGFLYAIEGDGVIASAALCEPDFLHSAEYFRADDDFEPEPLAYFGGAAADLAAFFLAGANGYVILANGMP